MEELKALISEEHYLALINSNVSSLSDIISQRPTKLADTTSLETSIIKDIQSKASEIFLKHKLKTVDQLAAWNRIRTGCNPIDDLLKGGIPCKGVVEITGASGVGKSQLCLQLSLMIQINLDNAPSGKACLYIYTETSFPSKRLHQLSNEFKSKHCNIEYEDNIFLERISDCDSLNELFKKRIHLLLDSRDIGLIIIDSIAAIFRSENLETDYIKRSQQYNYIIKFLNTLHFKYNLAIICINQVTDNPNTGQIEPALGLAWSNLITFRFSIKRFNLEQTRVFEIVFAPDLPRNKTKFLITPRGLVEVT